MKKKFKQLERDVQPGDLLDNLESAYHGGVTPSTVRRSVEKVGWRYTFSRSGTRHVLFDDESLGEGVDSIAFNGGTEEASSQVLRQKAEHLRALAADYTSGDRAQAARTAPPVQLLQWMTAQTFDPTRIVSQMASFDGDGRATAYSKTSA